MVPVVTLGRYLTKSSKVATFSWDSDSAVSAWIVMGTSWMFSVRRWAVTVISEIASELSPGASAARADAPLTPRMEQIA